jgi:hypothetical protein
VLLWQQGNIINCWAVHCKQRGKVIKLIAMKKRLTFFPTVGLMLLVFFGVIAFGVLLLEIFHLPDWITPFISIVGAYLLFEVIARPGPGEIEPPSIKFMKLSIRDRIVLVVAILTLFILALPLGMRFDSLGLKLLFSGLGLLASWLICYFFGSTELMKRMPKD